MSRVISFIALLAIVVLFGILFFQVMAIFVLPVFLALILIVVFKPLHRWFMERLPGRARASAGLTTLSILVIVLLPLMLILARAAAEGWSVVSALTRGDTLKNQIQRLRQELNLELPPEPVRTALEDIELDLMSLGAGPRDQASFDKPNRQLGVVTEWLKGPGQAFMEHRATDRDPYPENAVRVTTLADGLKKSLGDLKKADEEGNSQVSGLLDNILDTHKQLKRELLGDTVWYFIRAKANPGPDEVKGIQTLLQDWLAPAAVTGSQILIKLVIGLCIMIIALYYFLADGPAMLIALLKLSPLDQRYEEQLLAEFIKISRAVVVATLLSALVQGILAGIGFKLARMEAVFLLSVLTMFLAMVPFVGAAAVWVPCSIWLLLQGHTVAGSMLAVYGLCVVSMADNLIKPLVLHGQSNLHPLLALLSVLGGVKALGPIGIFVGPMAVVFLQTVLQMLHSELHSLGGRSSEEDWEGMPAIEGSEALEGAAETAEPEEARTASQ